MGHHSTGWCNLANVAFRSGSWYDREGLTSATGMKDWGLLVDAMERQLTPFGVAPAELRSSSAELRSSSAELRSSSVRAPPSSAELRPSRMLTHDPKRELFVGEHADSANRFLRREYRGKYKIAEA